MAEEKKINRKTAGRKKKEPAPKYDCLLCHRNLPETDFVKSRGSHVWTETGGRVLFCKDCIDGKFKMAKERYGERLALMIACHWCDVPYIEAVYQSTILKNGVLDFGNYTRLLNAQQYSKRSFINSIVDGEFFEESAAKTRDNLEAKWSREDIRNKKECITLLGYDPFEDFSDKDRKLLFGDLMNYLDEDLLDDAYKLSMVLQIVISNNQIRGIDLQMAKLDPARAADDIRQLSQIKKDLVSNVASISKENEISVRNRSTKAVGKGTLTALMKELREKDIEESEVNFYDMLQSPGTTWALEQSNKALMSHCLFDENDRQEIFMMQRELIQKLQSELDDTKEELRLTKIENKELRDG